MGKIASLLSAGYFDHEALRTWQNLVCLLEGPHTWMNTVPWQKLIWVQTHNRKMTLFKAFLKVTVNENIIPYINQFQYQWHFLSIATWYNFARSTSANFLKMFSSVLYCGTSHKIQLLIRYFEILCNFLKIITDVT